MEKQSRAFAPPAPTEAKPATAAEEKEEFVKVGPKLWYCKQCGYVVFREDPPYVCPICKAKREMFAQIKTRIDFL
jgi:rubrerythrin